MAKKHSKRKRTWPAAMRALESERLDDLLSSVCIIDSGSSGAREGVGDGAARGGTTPRGPAPAPSALAG